MVRYTMLGCGVCGVLEEFGPFVNQPLTAIGRVHFCREHGGGRVRCQPARSILGVWSETARSAASCADCGLSGIG